MTDIEKTLAEKAAQLLADGVVNRVAGWKKGEFVYDPSPAVFENPSQLKDFVYDEFCGANLSKYLIELSKKEGKTAVFLKPCDSYSLNQLIKEHRIKRESVYAVGVECHGKLDNFKIENKGINAVKSVVFKRRIRAKSFWKNALHAKGKTSPCRMKRSLSVKWTKTHSTVFRRFVNSKQ